MTSRERTLRAINREEPDRVPCDLGGWVTTISKVTYDRVVSLLGLKAEGKVEDWVQQTAIPGESVLQQLGIDTRYVRPGTPKRWKLKKEEDEKYYYITDAWGIKRAMPKEGGRYYDIYENPLKGTTIKDLESYPWPDPTDLGFTEGIEEKAKYLYENTDYAIVGDFNFASQYENTWYMRSFADFYMDMVANPDFVDALLEKMCELHIKFLDKVLNATGKYIHIVMQGDDLTGHDGPLMSPKFYRTFIKPRQRRIFSFIKEKTKAKIFYHCCGSVYQFIPDLIEIGADILNPVQVSAKNMDTNRLKKEFGDQISFWGAIDTQHILPFGTVQNVKEEVRKRIVDLAPGGGYILSAVHNIQSDVPPENVLAMYEAAKEYGNYPIMNTDVG